MGYIDCAVGKVKRQQKICRILDIRTTTTEAENAGTQPTSFAAMNVNKKSKTKRRQLVSLIENAFFSRRRRTNPTDFSTPSNP